MPILVMQRVMSAAAAAGAMIRPRARRACLGPYVMPACYLIRKKLARIKFVLAGNKFGAIRLRRRVLSRSASMDRSGSRVVEREVSGVGKLVWETKMGGQTRSVLYQSCQKLWHNKGAWSRLSNPIIFSSSFEC